MGLEEGGADPRPFGVSATGDPPLAPPTTSLAPPGIGVGWLRRFRVFEVFLSILTVLRASAAFRVSVRCR